MRQTMRILIAILMGTVSAWAEKVDAHCEKTICYAVAVHGRGHEALGIALARKAVALAEELGPDYVYLWVTYNNVASMYRQSGDLVRAESHYAKSLAALLRRYGPDDPGLIWTYIDGAEVAAGPGKRPEAIRLLLCGREIARAHETKHLEDSRTIEERRGALVERAR